MPTYNYDWVAGFTTFPTGALKATGITSVAVNLYNETSRVVVATAKAATKSADDAHWYHAPASLAAGELALIADGDTVRATFTATTADTDLLTGTVEDRVVFDAAVLSRPAPSHLIEETTTMPYDPWNLLRDIPLAAILAYVLVRVEAGMKAISAGQERMMRVQLLVLKHLGYTDCEALDQLDARKMRGG